MITEASLQLRSTQNNKQLAALMNRQGLAESGPSSRGLQRCTDLGRPCPPGRVTLWSRYSTAPSGHSADLDGPREDHLIKQLEKTPNETKLKLKRYLAYEAPHRARPMLVLTLQKREGAAMSPRTLLRRGGRNLRRNLCKRPLGTQHSRLLCPSHLLSRHLNC